MRDTVKSQNPSCVIHNRFISFFFFFIFSLNLTFNIRVLMNLLSSGGCSLHLVTNYLVIAQLWRYIFVIIGELSSAVYNKPIVGRYLFIKPHRQLHCGGLKKKQLVSIMVIH